MELFHPPFSFPALCRERTYGDGVDVGLMPGEGLAAGALPHVPQFGSGITSPRDEEFEVRGDGQAHAVSSVTNEHSLLLPRLDVPERAAGGDRRGEGLSEPAQAEQTHSQPEELSHSQTKRGKPWLLHGKMGESIPGVSSTQQEISSQLLLAVPLPKQS